MSPIRLCSTAGCSAVSTYRGRCPAHARTTNRDTHRNRHIYNSKRWKLLRRHIIANQPICAADGCDALSTDADHIRPIASGGMPFDPSNVQGLCAMHHGQKTRREMAA